MYAIGESVLGEVLAKNENPKTEQQLREAGDRVTPSEMDIEASLPISYSDNFTFYSIERMRNPKAILDEQDGIDNPA